MTARLLWLLPCILLGLSRLALAQQQATTDTTVDTIAVQTLPQTPEAPKAESSAAQLDGVVVTARRKKEKIEVVPISMTVLNGDKLADAGLSRPQDIQEQVPNLVVSVPNARLTSYTIRGLGSSSANDGMESSVGLYLDGVYLGRQGLSIFDLVDLDRVEVLRGPQGTLFGKNTTAGVFNVVTKQPTQDFEAKAEAAAGNLGYTQYRGSLNGGLAGDWLAGRITGYSTRRDGTVDNLYDGRRLNNQHRDGARGQLLFTPAENISSRLIAEYGYTSEDGTAFLLTNYSAKVRARDAYMEYQREPANPYNRVSNDDTRVHFYVRQQAVSNELNWTFSDFPATTLTSITAWRHWYFEPYNDDAMSLRVVPETGYINDHRQLSQELRLATRVGPVELLGGAFFIRQDLDSNLRVLLGRDAVPWALGGVLRQNCGCDLTKSNSGPALDLVTPFENVEGTRQSTLAVQHSQSRALFGNTDWHITPEWDASLGLRYTEEDKSATVHRRRTQPGTNGNVNFNDPATLTQLPAELFRSIGISDPRNVTLNLVLDQIAGADYDRDSRYSEGAWSGQFALGYQWLPNVRPYFTLAQGFKGGGINLGAISGSLSDTFKPETATSAELGVKSHFLRRRLTFNAAAYHTLVRDYQALTFDTEPRLLPNPILDNILNVGKVRLQGIEFDGTARPWRFLNLRLAASYSRAVTVDFKNAPNEDTGKSDKDLSGQRLFNAPILTGTAGIELRLPVASHLLGVFGLDESYRSNYYGTPERGRGSYQPGYALTNLTLGLRSERGIDVGLLVRNLFDRNYIAAINPLYGVGDYGAIVGDPRTVVLTARARFE
jgi:iron complex outermembrane recepter protein